MQMQVNRHSYVTCKLKPKDAEAIGTLTKPLLDATLELLKANLRGSKLKAACREQPHAVRVLLNSFRTANSHVPGSGQAMASFRSKCSGVWSVFGAWTMFLNFNPSELNARACISLCGRDYEIDGTTGDPLMPPSSTERWRLIAGNPVACAEFFEAVICAIMEVYFGWPKGATKQVNKDCLFGIISAMCANYETSGRLALHMHGLICQPALQARRVLHYFTVGNANNIFAFLEFLACTWIPSPTHTPRPAAPGFAADASLTEQLQALKPAQPTPLMLLEAQVPAADRVKAVVREAQLDTWTHEEMCQHIGMCVVALQLHAHSHTCAKNGHRGDDVDCRMLYPRTLVLMTILLARMHVLMRRDHPNVVPFNPSLMLAMPFNHAIYILCDQSRWARRKELYDEAVARGDRGMSEPLLFDMVVEAFLAACYALKYSTKVDCVGINAPVLDIAKVR